jgi:hypothetical protein
MGFMMMLVPLGGQVKDNLAKYSVYYAGNLPHKVGTDPELVAVIDNLDKIYIPNLDQSTKVVDEFSAKNYISSKNRLYQYDFLTHTIYYKKNNEENYLYKNKSSDKKQVGYVLTLWKGEDSQVKTIDLDGRLIYLLDSDEKKNNPKNSDLLNFEKEKELLFGNIIKTKQKPSINLQFIYNYLNESKFN